MVAQECFGDFELTTLSSYETLFSFKTFFIQLFLQLRNQKALELRASGVELRHGTTQREKTLRDFVDLKYIYHIFVPSFKVKEVADILRVHGHEHIQVLPLGQTKE